MRRRHVSVAACFVTIAACLPYLALKALWLTGSTVGAASAAGAAELVDTRHLVGDVVTAGMELAAIALVLALTFRWGRRLPAVAVLAPIWVATGLLAPIALGLPLGLVAQAFAGGAPAPTDNGLEGWVYATVYGGFVVQAAGLLVAFVCHARDRWPEVFRMRTAQLRAVAGNRRRLAAVAAPIAVGYAAMLALWSATGARWGGPAGFDTVTQRVFLLATGLVVAAGAFAVRALLRRRGDRRILVPLVLVWIGTGVTVMSGPTHVALSHNGSPSPLLVSLSIAATLAGLVLAGTALRALRHHITAVGRTTG